MARYLNTIGNSSVAIGICGRCSRKFAIVDLEPDPNSPGLMVCAEDKDWLDPYRLPPHEVETITLTMPRPDDPLVTTSVYPGVGTLGGADQWVVVAPGPYPPPVPSSGNTGRLVNTGVGKGPISDGSGTGSAKQTPGLGNSS